MLSAEWARASVHEAAERVADNLTEDILWLGGRNHVIFTDWPDFITNKSRAFV